MEERDDQRISSAESKKDLGNVLRVEPPRPNGCRRFTRARVAEALPEIVDCFVAEAKKGSVPHAKMLVSLGGLDKREIPQPAKRKGKTLVGRLLEDLEQGPAK